MLNLQCCFLPVDGWKEIMYHHSHIKTSTCYYGEIVDAYIIE